MFKILHKLLAHFVPVGGLPEVLFLEELQVNEVVSVIDQLGKALEAQDDARDERGGIEVAERLHSHAELLE